MESRPRPVPRQEERFASWKEIAVYLKRDVRTVQRWEATRGLPVHRVPGSARSPIYALRSELDEWWASTPARQESPTAMPPPPPGGLRNWRRVAGAVFRLPDSVEVGDPDPAARKRGRPLWIWAVAAVLLVTAMVWLWRSSFDQFWRAVVPRRTSEIQLARLTFDSGVTTSAAISPDGKLAAYACDRSGEGNLDIWVQQIGGRQPIRVTRNGTDNSAPSFSPDGSRIAFRSERDGGGIYLVDSLGGPELRIAANGYFPRFSPDGSHILFLRLGVMPGVAKMFLVGPEGGEPRPFQPEYSTRMIGDMMPSLTWSPDGAAVLFDGLRDGDPRSVDWWVAPLKGEPAIRTGAFGAFPQNRVIRSVWAWRDGFVYFLEGAMAESIDAYRVAPAPGTFAIRGPAEQLTRAGAPHVGLSIAHDGRMLLVRWEFSVNPWSAAFDANRGTLSSELRPVVGDSTTKAPPVCSRNGAKMAYVCWSGLRTQWRVELRERDLRTGQETVRAGRGDWLNMAPRLNADGSALAYRDLVDRRVESYVARGGADPQEICVGCGVEDFFPDSKHLLVAVPGRLERLDVETGLKSPVLTSPGPLVDPCLSPDGRWVAFVAGKPDGAAGIWIAPVKDSPAVPRDWIPIAEDGRVLNFPQWSPDGNLLYYVSSRDGWACAWGQRLDPATKKPHGEALAVMHSHRTPGFRGLPRMSRACAVGADRLICQFVDIKGGVWTAKVGSK